MKKLALMYCCFITATAVWASRPIIVSTDSRPQFERGTAQNVSISDKGVLTRARQKTMLLQTEEPYILSLTTDQNENIYVGTGNDGKVFKISKKQQTLFFDAAEIAIAALASDKQNNIYAATFPESKIYKILPDGSSELFFAPEAAYIWDMKFDAQGALYIATGQPAQIIKIHTNGKKEILLQADVEHIRALALSGNTIYAGSSGKALVLKIDADKRPFVVYDPQTEEINSLFIAADGSIYAATTGESMAPTTMQIVQRQPQTATGNGEENQSNGNDSDNATQNSKTVMQPVFLSASAPTSLYKISANGLVQDFWLGKQESIQGIFPASDNQVLVGTGKNGKLYKVDDSGNITLIYEMQETQITAFAQVADKLILATSNMGNVYQIGPQAADTCAYISAVNDAGMTANWGMLNWQANNDAKVKFYTRSGNTESPDAYWANWMPVAQKGQIASPAARFLQWKCEFVEDAEITKVDFSFQQVNFPPRVSSVIIHPPGDFYAADEVKNKEQGVVYPAMLPGKTSKKGFRTVDWIFEDPNYDHIQFNLYYRLTNSSHWYTLAENWGVNFYSWDTAQMQDGIYEIKITATDALDNAKTSAAASESSEPFIVDNSGPQIQLGNKYADGYLVHIQDALSPLKAAFFSVDAQDWQKMYTKDGILDSDTELFLLPISDAEKHTIAVKALDDSENYTVIHFNVGK